MAVTSTKIWKDLGVPTYDELIWPTIKALKALGGSARNKELLEKIIELEAYSEEVQQFPHKEGLTKVDYNAAWARTVLKMHGAITNKQTGLWVLLDKGEILTEDEAKSIPTILRAQYLSKPRPVPESPAEPTPTASLEFEEEEDWREKLLNTVRSIKPDAFERLCQRILRESGFVKVQVTGRSGDGGIDGIGILRVNIISFHVLFQCKRYQGSVGAGELRDFRGAMMGRTDKGILITTGSFTSDARKEANRDGAPAIELIDGEDLCDLLKDLKLGVTTELIEKVTIQPEWFEGI